MTQEQPRKRRRAVGPPGAVPPGDEPRPDVDEPRPEDERREVERFLADRPPHHRE